MKQYCILSLLTNKNNKIDLYYIYIKISEELSCLNINCFIFTDTIFFKIMKSF